MADKFRLLVRAKADGFYGDRKHYSLEGKNKGHKRAGAPFAILADALRYDRDGRMEVTKDLKPVLPSWIEVINPSEWKPIDPKATPHIVKERKEKPNKRFRPKEVTDAAPMAWPKNQKGRKLRDEDDDDREVTIKRAGVPGGMNPKPGNEEEED